MTASFWEFYQGLTKDGYLRRKYITDLGRITSVEIISLGEYPSPGLEKHFPHLTPYRRHFWSEAGRYVHFKKRITGRDAQEFAKLWRSQTIVDGAAGCHEPAYVFRFYLGPWKRAEITVCWQCFNAEVPWAVMAAPISFDAHGTNGVTLFDLAKQWAPLSTAETYAYTNPAISSEEIKRLVSVAIHSDYKAARDFVEYVAHSESRVTFEDEIVSRLDDPSSQNRSWAIDRIAELKTPRLARRLSQRMADPVEWIKTRAGWALTEMDGDVNMNAVLPEIISTNGEIRTVALAVAVRHGGSDSESLNRLGLQIDDVISQHGTNAFPKADRRRVKLTADRRHTLKSLLDRLKSAGIDTEMFRDRTPPPRPEFE
jgi:hypothetical protein